MVAPAIAVGVGLLVGEMVQPDGDLEAALASGSGAGGSSSFSTTAST